MTRATTGVDLAKLPMPYACASCGTIDVRLWRQYSTFLHHQSLLCRQCAEVEQRPNLETLGPANVPSRTRGPSHSIGWRVPALPDDTGTFWGYASAPQRAIDWWTALPEVDGPQ